MPGKWIALLLIGAGIAMVLDALRRTQSASLNDSTFPALVIEILAGLLLAMAGGIWIMVILASVRRRRD